MPTNIAYAFQEIRNHASFKDLKLKVAVYSIKHSSKKPFMSETYGDFTSSLETYVGGAFAFAQEALKMFFEHHGEASLSESGGHKKGTLIFTGTLGALRTNAEYGAYGAGRAGVRQLAQSLAREMSVKGIHVVHAIANGGIADEEGEEQRVGKRMSADAVGRTYLWLAQQEPELWTHELDMRPAQEKF
jgi:NAD(P)-dependent dehydrogenase (short-subunit alcohol dehydrogenase family)